ncbi:MAG: hypothetical protein CM1200mP9_11510 [Gammaproteobacteria bacterium]|nr:MAG: hypothetical protein CM1200mP9_11510 [Gammaproteobacteria bacterium]
MTEPYPAHPQLQGNFAPIRMEADIDDLVIEGELHDRLKLRITAMVRTHSSPARRTPLVCWRRHVASVRDCRWQSAIPQSLVADRQVA